MKHLKGYKLLTESNHSDPILEILNDMLLPFKDDGFQIGIDIWKKEDGVLYSNEFEEESIDIDNRAYYVWFRYKPTTHGGSDDHIVIYDPNSNSNENIYSHYANDILFYSNMLKELTNFISICKGKEGLDVFIDVFDINLKATKIELFIVKK